MQQTLAPNPEIWTVQRRPLDLEDYIAMVRRNVGWVLGPILAGLTAASVVASFWPSTYVSTAVIRVVPAQVPERLVATNVSQRMEERVQSMAQTILSRNTLTNLIQTYSLYESKKRRLPLEDVIEGMQKDINIGGLRALSDPTHNNSAFQISFSYDNRYIAQKVTRDLMGRFIDENIRERSSQSKMTTEFLKEQLADAKRELDGLDQQLTQFRMANLGRLPEQMDSNMQQVAAIESRIAALNNSASRASQEKSVLEGELRGLREKIDSLQRSVRDSAMPGSAAAARQQDEDPGMQRLNGEVANLQRQVQELLERYKANHPDVIRAQTRLKSVENERDSYLARRASASQSTPAASNEPVQPRMTNDQRQQLANLDSDVQRIQGMIRGKEIEIDRYSRDVSDAEKKQKDAQGRIEVGPANIQSYTQLTRDYNLAKERYDSLNLSVANSQMSTDIETRKQGETLEVLDLPSLPESPTAPNRPLIIGGGLGIGLVLGLVLVGFREMKDASLKSLKDVRAYTHFAVLGNIPLLENDLIIRRRRRMGWVGWSTAILASVVIIAVSVYYYITTRQ